METISLSDGLILTVISMLLVFLVLSAIWILTDFVAKVVNKKELDDEIETKQTFAGVSTESKAPKVNLKNQFAAEIIALILASEDEPNRKFEVVESKKIK